MSLEYFIIFIIGVLIGILITNLIIFLNKDKTEVNPQEPSYQKNFVEKVKENRRLKKERKEFENQVIAWDEWLYGPAGEEE